MLKKILIILLLLSNITLAAKIQGIIYDNSLNRVNNVIVEIQPLKQRYVAKFGAYNFEIPLGTYIIIAKKNDYMAEDKIIIDKEGTYNLDLILFPSFEEEEILLNESEIEIELIEEEKNNYELYVIPLILIILMVWKRRAFLRQYRKAKKIFKKQPEEIKQQEVTNDLEGIIKFIKNKENRTTQKEIRKHLNLSEAKISLMIAELESLGKIKKIKKGRGNIIILNDRKDN